MVDSYSNCIVCNSQFKPVKSKANKFCGVACYRVHQRNGNYKRGSTLQSVCVECGCLVVGRSSSRKRNGNRSDKIFCDRVCYDSHRAKVRCTELGKCLQCDKVLSLANGNSRVAKYCSLACRNEHKKSKDRHCISCGVWFSSLKWNKSAGKLVADNTRKTCSSECFVLSIKNNESRKLKISAAFQGSKHPNWQGGAGAHNNRGFRGSDWNKIRLFVIKRDGFKCKMCGIDRDAHLVKHKCDFNVNHKIPFHQFGGKTALANKLSNLETLCKSCHTKKDWEYRKNNPIQQSLNL